MIEKASIDPDLVAVAERGVEHASLAVVTGPRVGVVVRLLVATLADVGEGRVRATVRGGTFDPDRHEGVGEIKAITYHGLKVEPIAGGYLAEVILDI